jgi:O-antigen/teichoic acid export membrane protein
MNLAVKAAFWFTICNFILKGISFVTTPIFARVLSPDEYGKLAIFMSYESIICILSTWEIPLSAYQRGLFKFKDEVKIFTNSSIMLSNVITTIFFIFIFISFKWFGAIIGLPPKSIILLYIYMMMYPAYNCWIMRKRKNYEYKLAVVLTILNAVFSVIFPLVAVFAIQKKAEVKFDFTLIGSSIVFVYFYIIYLSGVGKLLGNNNQVIAHWKYIITFQAPLVIHSVSYSVLSQADRIMIGKMVGNSEAAYYSVAYSIAQTVFIVQSSVMQAMIPWIIEKLEKKDYESTRRSSGPLLFFMGIILSLFIFVAPEAIKLLFSADYYEAIRCIPPIAISVYFMFLNSLFVWVENYYERTRYVAYASVICAVVNVILNYFAIGIFGYVACAYTTLISYILFAFLHYLFVRKICKEQGINESIYDLKSNMLISLMLCVVMIIGVTTYEHVLIRYILFIIIIAILLLYRNKIKNFILKFRS